MKKCTCFIIGFLLLLGSAAHAVEVYKGDDKQLDIGIKGQIWGQTVEDAAPSGTDWSTDFSIKQIRIYSKGTIMPGIKFGANFDFNGYGTIDGKAGAAESTLTDGFLSFDSLPAFQVITGRFRTPFSRYSLNDSYTAYALPHAPLAADPKLVSGTSGYRMTGLAAWGMIGNRLRYNLGIADGTPEGLNGENDSKDSLQYIARVEFSPVGEEKGYVHTNEWLGKKKLMTIGGGYTTKRYDRLTGAGFSDSSYKAWTVDGYAEVPLQGGSAITGEAAYYLYDLGTPADPKTSSYYVQAGFLFPGSFGPGQLQPVMKYEEVKRDGIENDTKSWAAGLNYYLKGHDAKIMLEYLSVDNQVNANAYSGTAGKDRGALTLVLSFGI